MASPTRDWIAPRVEIAEGVGSCWPAAQRAGKLRRLSFAGPVEGPAASSSVDMEGLEKS
jgi:hypothetical protein